MYPKRRIRRRTPQVRLDSDLHPVLRRVFENRGIGDRGELDHSLNRMLPPDELSGIDRAAEILITAITERQPILIVGDYDVDGATATTVAIKGVQALGSENIDYLVPNRFNDGYGLSESVAARAIQQNPVVVITVDNGIASVNGVDLLHEAGIRVIITDHHLPGPQLPDADAIVNPNQPGCNFSSKALSGVGVMFYLLVATRARMRDRGLLAASDDSQKLVELLDLVALGTVADMSPLDQNNRILVSRGVARIRAGKACPGITELIRVSGQNYRQLVAADLGYWVAPRLNAAGRLDDISTGIDCLLSLSVGKARRLAGTLDEINAERKRIEQQMQQEAAAIVQSQKIQTSDERRHSYGICLYDPCWHQGVAGLVATRIREKIGLPVVVFARGEDGLLKGSARSIPDIHIRDLLDLISKNNNGLLVAFGGHAMAAGLTIRESDFPAFAKAFERTIESRMSIHAFDNVLMSDGQLPGDQFSLQLAEELRTAAPWGQSFPEPSFDGEFKVLEQKLLNGGHLKLRLRVDDCRSPLDAIHFKFLDEGQSMPSLDHVRLFYKLNINDYRGVRRLQLVVEYLELVDRTPK